MAEYVCFDWALKRLLCNKANYVVLEGLIYSLLNEKFKITKFLESESNQYSEYDKVNHVDLLAENEKGELALFQFQNIREQNYAHHILYGVSKIITEHIDLGGDYNKVKKVYSINIMYFSLGQAKDYVYHGKAMFQGMHEYDILNSTNIFPEYYLLIVNNFDHYIWNNLDEWIDYLNTGYIRDNAKAPGLSDARKCLMVDKLSKEDRANYIRYMENLRY